MDDLRQAKWVAGLNDQVNMIWHYAGGEQQIPLTIKFS
jgi:hypothetical protein